MRYPIAACLKTITHRFVRFLPHGLTITSFHTRCCCFPSGGHVAKSEGAPFKEQSCFCSCDDSPYRIYPGGLAVSRTIGDIGLKSEKTKLIIAEPDIEEVRVCHFFCRSLSWFHSLFICSAARCCFFFRFPFGIIIC